jgi:hypothetical protein
MTAIVVNKISVTAVKQLLITFFWLLLNCGGSNKIAMQFDMSKK